MCVFGFHICIVFVSDIGFTALLFSTVSKGHNQMHNRSRQSPHVSFGFTRQSQVPEKNVQKAAPHLFSHIFTKQTVQLASFIFSSFYIYIHLFHFPFSYRKLLTSAHPFSIFTPDPLIFVFSFAEFYCFFICWFPCWRQQRPSTKTWY